MSPKATKSEQRRVLVGYLVVLIGRKPVPTTTLKESPARTRWNPEAPNLLLRTQNPKPKNPTSTPKTELPRCHRLQELRFPVCEVAPFALQCHDKERVAMWRRVFQPYTLNPWPYTFSPKPQAESAKPKALNPKP